MVNSIGIKETKFSKLTIISGGNLLPQLIISTLPLWIISNLTESTIVADFAALWGGIAMLFWFWKILGIQYEMINLLKVSMATLVFIQNLAWLSSSLLHRFSLNISIEESLKKGLNGGLTFSYFAVSVVYATLFSLALSWMASNKQVRKLEIGLCHKLSNIEKISLNRIVLILVLILIFELVLIFTGVLGQRSIIVEGLQKGERPAWSVFLDSMLPLHLLLNAYFAHRIFTSLRRNYFFILVQIVSVAIILFVYFNKGRTSLVFSLLAQAYWFIFFQRTRPNLLKTIPIVYILYLVLSEVLLFSNFIRSNNSGLTNWKGSAIEVVPLAWKRFKDTPSMATIEAARTKRNVSTRALVIIPLALSIQLPEERKDFMFGKGLLHCFIWAIPGPLFPNKSDYPALEILLYQYFPIGTYDTANSIYLSSYTDFGWFGLFLYPFVIWIIWVGILYLLRDKRLKSLFILLVLGMFFQLAILGIGEGSMTSWFIACRTIFVFYIFNMLYSYFEKRGKISDMRHYTYS